jgi:hypothetical protein
MAEIHADEDGLMLDIEQAAGLAQRFLDGEGGRDGMPLTLVKGERVQVDAKFYFGCQTVAYLRSGEFQDMAIGTGYVCVDGETGKCFMLGAVESAGLDFF